MKNTTYRGRVSQNANSKTRQVKNTKISGNSGFIFNTQQRYGAIKGIKEIFADIIVYPGELQKKGGDNE